MGFIDCASGNSIWRGYDYYENKKVISWQHEGGTNYSGIVSGSNGEEYRVDIDKNHPRKSTCTCPFAAGRRVVCKHMIALYFTVDPCEAEKLLKEAEEYEKEEELRKQQHYEELRKYVMSLKKSELQDQLLDALIQLEERRGYYW